MSKASKVTSIIALFGLIILLILFCAAPLLPRDKIFPLGVLGFALFIPYIFVKAKKREERLYGQEEVREDYRR